MDTEVQLTSMLFMASRSCSSWCAEFRASSRISVSSLSFSQSSERSSDTAVSSPSPSSVVSTILQESRCTHQGQTPMKAKRLISLLSSKVKSGVCVLTQTRWQRSRFWAMRAGSLLHLSPHVASLGNWELMSRGWRSPQCPSTFWSLFWCWTPCWRSSLATQRKEMDSWTNIQWITAFMTKRG